MLGPLGFGGILLYELLINRLEYPYVGGVPGGWHYYDAGVPGGYGSTVGGDNPPPQYVLHRVIRGRVLLLRSGVPSGYPCESNYIAKRY